MEDTLGDKSISKVYVVIQSLNPCSNGRYSRRYEEDYDYVSSVVLILVLMEDTLGVETLPPNIHVEKS